MILAALIILFTRRRETETAAQELRLLANDLHDTQDPREERQRSRRA